jgi:putative thioredoxin
MNLLIDIGNTNLRWAIHADGQLGDAQCARHSGGVPLDVLAEWERLARPDLVVVANVAGAAVFDAVARVVRAYWGRAAEAVAANPANDTARFDYLRALLMVGRLAEAEKAHVPVAGKMLLDARLIACGHWIDAYKAAATARSPDILAAAIAANRRDFDARFELAQTHFAERRFTEAMDELLEIVMRDKAWSDERARKTYVAVLEVMSKPAPAPKAEAAPKGAVEVAGLVNTAPADPVVDQYRRKLSMALF